jgi:hypothetical protein
MYLINDSQNKRMRESKVRKLFVDVSCKHVCSRGSNHNEIPTEILYLGTSKSSNDITLDATIKHINRRKHAVLFVISKAD